MLSVRNVGRLLVAFALIWGLGNVIGAFATLGHPATGWVEHAGSPTDWIAILIGLIGLLLVLREAGVKREAIARRRARREQRHLELQAEFRELRFALDPDGERRFVYAWPASWEAESLAQPDAPMPWKDAFFLHWAARQLQPPWIPQGIRPQDADHFLAQGGRFLHETDPARSKRLRFLYTDRSGRRAFLGMMPTQEGRAEPFDVCVTHRRFLAIGTPNCGECGLPMAKVRERNPEVLRSLGIEPAELLSSTGTGPAPSPKGSVDP
jgi:hypothetical protein